jgi:hypothetical protein
MKRISGVAILLLLVLGIAGQASPAYAVEAAALGVSATLDSIDCTSVEGAFSWTVVPDDGWVYVLAQDDFAVEQGFYYLIESFRNEGGIADSGSAPFTMPFETTAYEWTLFLRVYDAAHNPVLEVSADFSRPCLPGYVGGGGTGDDDDAPAPVDARSGVTSEPDDTEPAGDPDDDGRVQVP